MNIKLIIFFLVLSSRLLSIPNWLNEIDLKPDESKISTNADCIVLLNQEDVIIKNAETAKINTKVVYKILTSDGKKYAKIAIKFKKGDKCSIKGWRFTKDKVWKPLPKTSIYETSSLSVYGIYNDNTFNKRAYFQYVIPGDIIAFETEQTIKNWSVTYQSFVFQDNQPTINTKFSITIPDGWQLQKSERNLDSFKYYNENNIYVWRGLNLPFQEKEPYSVYWDYLIRSIKVVAIDPQEKKYSFKNWDNISKWYFQECSDKIERTESIKNKTSEIIDQATTTFEKCKRIADFVKSKIMYVNIKIGKNSIIPHHAYKTLENAFGDCKDKSILMISMLSEIGIEAYPVLVNTYSPIDKKLPTPFQFNHCIVGIPAEQFKKNVQTMGTTMLFFDPTEKNSIFGNTVDNLHLENVLVCTDKDNLNLIVIPAQNPSNKKKKYITVGKVNEDGSFIATCKIVYLNNQIPRTMDWLKNNTEEELIKGLFNPIGNILGDVEINQFKKEIFADSVVVSYKIVGNGIVRNSGNYQVFHPNIYADYYPGKLQNKQRKTPIFFGEYKDFIYLTNWEIPSSWKLKEETFHKKSGCEGENTELNVLVKNNKVSLMLRIQSFGKAIPASKYTTAKNYEKEKVQLINYKLLIPNTGVENDKAN